MVKIAIDGPAGSGKSTIAKLLARELGYLYIDSGALYRSLTWHCLEKKIDMNNDEEITRLGLSCPLKLLLSEKGELNIFVGETCVNSLIRLDRVSRHVSLIARLSPLRKKVVQLLREFDHPRGIVMDGRDIGTVVFPEAEYKFFLTAGAEERAKRRVNELKERGEQADFEDILKSIRDRDRIDSERADSPLKAAEDAISVDTTALGIDDVREKLAGMVLNGHRG
ncbi:MAG: (d)CMP kinase [Candidatus Wallbacteria bacterium]|nr:(d)CMP kinase [Candidatus Wallbacteria bacterium]